MEILIAFEADSLEDISGFDDGRIVLYGSNEESIAVPSMIVVTAALLLDQLRAWARTNSSALEFIAVDNCHPLLFERKDGEITVRYRGKFLGPFDINEFWASALKGSLDFYRFFVSRLPEKDVARKNFEAAIADFS